MRFKKSSQGVSHGGKSITSLHHYTVVVAVAEACCFSSPHYAILLHIQPAASLTLEGVLVETGRPATSGARLIIPIVTVVISNW